MTGGPPLGLQGENVQLRQLTKYFGDVCAVADVSLEIRPGELITLLGPSGSGKTTTLMIVAGFTEPTSGEIWIGGRNVTELPPHRRDVGVVFQNFALFPHMTVSENVAFPLRMRRLPEAQIVARVEAALALVQLPGFGRRLPTQLSGGQQQRVAVARAIVFDPPLLLLDEPFGALDKKLRESMQLELKALHARLGLTMIHVTHDQSEALALSDRVAVMNHGRIEQVGTPKVIYEKPVNRFVADFVGESNFLVGAVQAVDVDTCSLVMESGLECVAPVPPGVAVGMPVELMVRPERMAVGSDAVRMRNRFEGRLTDLVYAGELIRCRVRVSTKDEFAITVQNRRGGPIEAEGDGRVLVGWDPADGVIFARAEHGKA